MRQITTSGTKCIYACLQKLVSSEYFLTLLRFTNFFFHCLSYNYRYDSTCNYHYGLGSPSPFFMFFFFFNSANID